MNDRIKELNQTLGLVLGECPELTYIGNPILRKPTEEVSSEEARIISEKLQVTLKKYRDISGLGRGLAAPQIGESKSVFVTYVGDAFKTYGNPKITKISLETNMYRESCLSCGFLSVDIRRPASVTIEYTNEDGEIICEDLTSFSARLVQHEYDHLLGIVNIDKAEPGSIDFMLNDPLKEEIRTND